MTRRKLTTILVKHRLNERRSITDIARMAKIGRVTVGRIERGDAVMRVKASSYLEVFGIFLNKPETIPAELKIIDEGTMIRICSRD